MLGLYTITSALSSTISFVGASLFGAFQPASAESTVDKTSDNPADVAVAQIQQEMEQRNNLFYTLGKKLSNLLHKKLNKLLIDKKPPKKRDMVSDKNTKKAIAFVSTDDHNGGLADNRTPNKWSRTHITNSGYDYRQRPISGAAQICDTLTAEFENTQFDRVIFRGHGWEYGMRFGPNKEEVDAYLTDINVIEYLKCLPKHLHPHAKVIYIACSVGSLRELPLDWYYMLEGDNIFSLIENMDYFFIQNYLIQNMGGKKSFHINLAFQTYLVLNQSFPQIEVAGPRGPAALYMKNIDVFDDNSFGMYPFDANYHVVYNEESVALIYRGWEIVDTLPHFINRMWPFSLFTESPEQKAFEDNQKALLKALKFVPLHTYKDLMLLNFVRMMQLLSVGFLPGAGIMLCAKLKKYYSQQRHVPTSNDTGASESRTFVPQCISKRVREEGRPKKRDRLRRLVKTTVFKTREGARSR